MQATSGSSFVSSWDEPRLFLLLKVSCLFDIIFIFDVEILSLFEFQIFNFKIMTKFIRVLNDGENITNQYSTVE